MSGNFVDLGIPGVDEAEVIGSGGFATVYRAVQPQLNRTVAVKVIQSASDPTTMRRFEREARALGSLSEHPGIVTLYSTGQTSSSQPYFIMQYCPSGSLQDRLNTGGPLSVTEACRAIAQLASSLADAHDRGILHRDLKPANALIDISGSYLVADFGIAAITDSTAGMSTSVSFTAGFVAPEILQGEQPTTAGDVYSLGATFFALLVAKMPFASAPDQNQNALAVMMRLSNEAVEDIRPYGVPDAVASLIEQCMSKDRSERPTMRALASAALHLSQGVTPQANPLAPSGPAFLPAQPPQPGATPPLPSNVVGVPIPGPAVEADPTAAGVTPGGLHTLSYQTPAQQAAPAQSNSRRIAVAAVAVALLLGLAGVGLLRLLNSNDDTVIPALVLDPTDSTLQRPSQIEPTAIPTPEPPDTPDDGTDTTASGSAAAPTSEPAEDATATPPTEPGGNLTLLQRQMPSALNPYLNGAGADLLASSLVLEPLANIAPDGSFVPALAAKIPVAGDGISNDGTRVSWTLRQDLIWADGTPVTAADVVFTWEYCTDPATQCSVDSAALFDETRSVEQVDELTVTVVLTSGTAYPYAPFVGFRSPILQRSQFQNCVGAVALSCTAQNQSPIGTGPYVVTEFNNTGVNFASNPNYRDARDGKPFFSTVSFSGGGDSEADARRVVEDGTADYAGSLIADPAFLSDIAARGNGRLESAFANNVEHINLNQTDNRAEGDLQSDFAAGSNPHPLFFENPQLTEALSLAIDRDALVAASFGPAARPTCNLWNVARPPSSSTGWCLAQDTAKANGLLDELGYLDTDGDGIREQPNGTPLIFDFASSTTTPRPLFQQEIADDWAEVGIGTNIQSEDPVAFFTPDQDVSIWQFPGDMVMFTNGPPIPEAHSYLAVWATSGIPTADNGWNGLNIPRFSSQEYDELLVELQATSIVDPARNQIAFELDDLLSRESGAVIPLVLRGSVSAFANDIANVGTLNGWDGEFWNIEDWTRDS